MPEQRPPQEIADIVEAVSNRDPNISVIEAVGLIRQLGYFCIGTAQSEPVHEPVADQRFMDRNLGHYVYVEEPGVKVLQTTWSGKLAIATAVFGDINKQHQRHALGIPLDPEPLPYGWFGDSYDETQAQHNAPDGKTICHESMVGVQAHQKLLHVVRQKHDAIQGSIDVLSTEGRFYWIGGKLEPDELRTLTRPGILLTQQAQTTIATMPVWGSDLWETGIVPLIKPTDT